MALKHFQKNQTGPEDDDEFDEWASRQMAELHSRLVQIKQSRLPKEACPLEQANFELERVRTELEIVKAELEGVKGDLDQAAEKLEKATQLSKEKEEEGLRYIKRTAEKQKELDNVRLLIKEANGIAHRKRKEVAELDAKLERRQKRLNTTEWNESSNPTHMDQLDLGGYKKVLSEEGI